MRILASKILANISKNDDGGIVATTIFVIVDIDTNLVGANIAQFYAIHGMNDKKKIKKKIIY